MKALGEIIYFSLGIEKCLTEEYVNWVIKD